MEQMQQENSANFVLSILSTMSTDAKADLVSLLQSSGYDVTTDTSSDVLLQKALFAIKDSSKFRNLFTAYVQSNFGESSFSGNEEGFYSNVTGAGKVLGSIGTGIKSAGSWVGSNVLTKDTIGALTGAGVGYLSTKLQNKANKEGDQRAIDLAAQQARAAEAQAAAEASRLALAQQGGQGAGSGTGGAKSTPKWVLPVAIGGGILIIGTIILLATRRN